MTALTGATGFLGRYLAEELLRRGHRVRVLVRNARRLRVQGVEVVEGDVSDVTALEEAFDGAETVIHNAAMVSFMKSRRETMRKTNVGGTENAVNVALETGVRRFVYIGSVAALGRPASSAVLDETARWTDSPYNTYYGYTKYLAEKHVYRGCEEGLNAVIVHPAAILGYGEENHGSPSLFFRAQQGTRICPAGGTGFVAAEDVARAVALLAETDRHSAERYILSAENLSYLQLFRLMNPAFGHRPPARTISPALAYLYGLWQEFKATMTGKESVVTRESARTAGGLYRYDGTRITRDFDFCYTPVAKTIERVAAQMRHPQKQNF